MRYYISDLHFWHRALNKHMDKRGFESVEEMNDYMVERWNAKVRPNDEVVILGDFSWGTPEETRSILERLNGRLYLIRGNHDRFLDDKKFDSSRFIWIKDYCELSDNKRKVVLSHYPIACYNGQYRRNAEGNPTAYMLHGHIHNTQDQQFLDKYVEYVRSQKHMSLSGNEEHVPCNLINCFCGYSDYQPMSLDEWIEIDNQRRQLLQSA